MSASSLLAGAFQNDPYFSWAEPNPTRRPRTLTAVFDGMLEHSRRTGGHLFEPGIGSVDWRDAPAANMSWWATFSTGLWRVALATTPAVVTRLSRHDQKAMALLEPHLPKGSVYLSTLGVDVTQHGRGHGSALLKKVFALQAERWHTVVLRTEQPKNVPFYLRNGFRLVDEQVIALSGLRVWAFSRPLR